MRKKLTRFSLMMLCVFLLGNGIPTAQASVQSPAMELVAATESGLVFEVTVPWQSLTLQEIQAEGKNYTQIILPGYLQSLEEGAPQVPMLVETIGIPFGVELELKVTPGKAHTQSFSAQIMPVETQKTSINAPSEGAQFFDSYSIITERIADPHVYRSAEQYPDVLAEVSNIGTIRQQRVAGISLYPVQVSPLNQKVTIYESLRVEVKFKGKVEPTQVGFSKPESAEYERFFESNLLNYAVARSWRQNTPTEITATPWMPPSPAWRITTRQEGIYRLSYEQLQTAGVPVTTIDPQTLQLFHLGSEVAIAVESALPHQFSPGDGILFYAQAIQSKYTSENVYWLTFGNMVGLRMGSVEGAPNESPVAEAYLASLYHEANINYIAYITAPDEFEHFLGEYVYPQQTGHQSITLHFTVDNPSADPGVITASLYSYLEIPEHRAILKLNGEVLGEPITWGSFEFTNVFFEFPAERLVVGDNTLEFTTDLVDEIYYIDWVNFAYSRQFVANNDLLRFETPTPGSWNYTVHGFSTNEGLQVFDLSDPTHVQRIENAAIDLEGAQYLLRFSADVTSAAEYWVGTENAFLTVSGISWDEPSDWQSSSHAADYLVITHGSFLDQANQLAGYRQEQSLGTAVVDVQDLYDEFNYGIPNPTAIRDFLALAYSTWQAPAPSYVVLLGDASFDPKNYLGFNRTNYMPPYLSVVDPELGETAADNKYVTLMGMDELPDLMLGRLAVNTMVEAQNVVNKIIAYEVEPAQGDWKQKVLAIADSYESGWPFPNLSDELLREALPDNYEAERVYLGVTHPTINEARAAIINGINSGKFLVNYIGHAAVNMWSAPFPGMFIVANINSLTNQGQYPIVLSMTCWDGYYIYPNNYQYNKSLAEEFTKVPGKGAIAAWSPTGISVARGHEYLDRGFFDAIFALRMTNLGQAASNGKLYLWATGAYLELLNTYLLFGDPATHVGSDFSAVDDFYNVNEDEELDVPVEQGVIANDIFPLESSITAELVQLPSHGTVNLESNGSFSYAPNPDYFGSEAFRYRLYDGERYSNTAGVRIYVNPVNDPPVALDQDIWTFINEPMEIELAFVDDGGGISIVTQGQNNTGIYPSQDSEYTFTCTPPTHGVLQGTAPFLVYIPDQDYIGADEFTFTVNDGEYNSNPATVTITVYQKFTNYLPLLLK